ncbi:MAG: hypothetical protein LUO97_05040 [Methanomicrobiales archaeon]|nr:hypothetical protein [Methanomicrobiales archaeon]MDD1669150.1 hypothetical protein [Methanomicrobiales archaeon]
MKVRYPLLLSIMMAGLLVTCGCTGFVGSESPGQTSPMAIPSAAPSSAPGPVVEADAYPPQEPHEIDPRFVRNNIGYTVDPVLFTEVYNRRFSMTYNSVGLLATVEKAPLVIDFSVHPGNRDPVYSFFILTVRDAGSRVVVGQEGYGRTFSTENPKRLVFMSPGKYHLNLYGNWVDVDLSIRMKS